MTTWNPLTHLHHAWSGTSTRYGKIALVLFYSLIWIGIGSSLWSICFPMRQGCIPDSLYETDDQKTGIAVFIRLVNLLWIGFYAYADMGKLKVLNVAIVATVLCIYTVLMMPLLSVIEAYGCDSMKNDLWVLRIWAVAALIFTILEDKQGGSYADV